MTSADLTTAAQPDGPASLRALWQPGVGLAVWFAVDATDDQPPITDPAVTDPADADPVAWLPEPLHSVLASKRARREIVVVGADGARHFHAVRTLGSASAIAFLDATRSMSAPGDVRWLRHILDGARRFVAAGAVMPVLAEVAGEPELRWRAIPTSHWRSWSTVVGGGAPPALAHNGGESALADFAAEVIDRECRTRIAASSARLGSPAPTAAVVAALVHDGTAPPAAQTSAAWAAWTRWGAAVPADDTTLVFRLHEPDDGTSLDDLVWGETPTPPDDRWRLQVCRHTADGAVTPVEIRSLDPTELDRITSDLASAVRAFDRLGHADQDPTSLDFLLSTEIVEALLEFGGAAITDAGFPVLLPRTIAEVRPTLGVRARPQVGGGAPARMVGLHEIRDFEWRLALGDGADALSLSDSDIDELARQKGSLVRLRGRWLRADGAALSRAAAFVVGQRARRTTEQTVDMGELLGMITGDTDKLPVPVTSVQGLSWLDDIATTGTLRPTTIAAPNRLVATLRPYQQRGLEWLAHLSSLGIGAVLADDMGLGKTLQVIALLCHEREVGNTGSSTSAESDCVAATLIVCPMSVVGNWAAELARFAPHLRVRIHHGSNRARDEEFGAVYAENDVVLTTFAIASRDRTTLAAQSWRRVVVDEAQHVKNVRTAAAKAVRAVPAQHRIALTGTPVENRLEDLRAVLDLVNPGLLGSPSVFRNRFAEPIERDRDPHALRRLTALTRPFVLRREKSDPAIVSDLPNKAEFSVRVNLTMEQAGLYRAVVDELMEALRDKQQRALRRQTVLAALTRLKQICNHPAHYLADGSAIMRRGQHRSGKVELATDILTTLVAEGDRALVFTQFAAFGELLAPWLSEQLGAATPMLHGGLSRAERDRMVADFQAGDGPPVLLATLKAGGTGLNLTAANHVVHVDRWWNPAVEDQATDRAYRIGQQRQVYVRRFVCVGTLEERIDDLIAKKRELSQLTVSAGESWMSDLGDEEIFDLFRLRDEAVSE